jgi:hypothetical protein
MSQLPLQTAAWYQALTLAERAALLRAAAPQAPARAVDTKQAERRMLRWRGQSPLPTAPYFAQRLAADGISEDELRLLLGQPIEALHDRCTSLPAWLADLAQAFVSCSATHDTTPLASAPAPNPSTTDFLKLIEPLVQRVRHRVRADIQTMVERFATIPFDQQAVEAILFADQPALLTNMLLRTMVLELNVARLQGLLDGDTPEARYQSFLLRIRQPDIALGLLAEYTVLAELLVLQLVRWRAWSLEFLVRFCA